MLRLFAGVQLCEKRLREDDGKAGVLGGGAKSGLILLCGEILFGPGAGGILGDGEDFFSPAGATVRVAVAKVLAVQVVSS